MSRRLPGETCACAVAGGVNGGTVVACEADAVDPGEPLGWCAAVVGRAGEDTPAPASG